MCFILQMAIGRETNKPRKIPIKVEVPWRVKKTLFSPNGIKIAFVVGNAVSVVAVCVALVVVLDGEKRLVADG